MKIHLRFGMHKDIEAIHDSQDLIDGLVIPAHILAYQHASTSAFVCSLPDRAYVIDPMTFLLQSPTSRHLNDAGEIRKSVSKWCEQIHGSLTGIVDGAAGPMLSPSDLPQMREMCEGLYRFQNESIDAGHVDSRAKKYLDRYDLTAATKPRAILAPYYAFESVTDPWYSRSKSAAETMKEVAGSSDEVAAILACGTNTLDEATSKTIAKDFQFLPRVFVWVDRFKQSSASPEQIRSVRKLVSELTKKKVAVEFLYGGFMAMLMGYEDGLEAISHGILYTQDKTFAQVPGGGGVPERYYIPKFHDFRSLGQTNLILKQHPELASGTPTADAVMKGDPDRVFLFANSPELLRRHFLEARRAECESINDMTLADQLAELKATHKKYHTSVSRLPNPDAIMTSGGMKGLDYLLSWRKAFS